VKPETIAVHAYGKADASTGALTAPINLSTVFERDADGDYRRGYSYQRKQNPNREQLEHALRDLEGAAGAVAFASGSAAITAFLLTLRPGDHVIAPVDAYYGTRLILDDAFSGWGLETTYLDTTDISAVRAAVRSTTRVIWVETPSNPMLTISDLTALSHVAHDADALCICDNTLSSPLLQHPIALGADASLHATTKYIGGHSDVTGGVFLAREEGPLLERMRHFQHVLGAVPSPFDCWLTGRGLRTLPYRMRAHCDHALIIARWLREHPRVERVLYPGLPDHPNHDLAARQMTGFSGVLSFCIRGGASDALAVCAKLDLITRATSFGGVETTIEHRASIEGPTTKTPPNLLRLSVGLEHPDDLIADLAFAL
jgi:cystathionine gamma-synthase